MAKELFNENYHARDRIKERLVAMSHSLQICHMLPHHLFMCQLAAVLLLDNPIELNVVLQGTTDPAEVARVDGVMCLCYREQQILQKWHELMESCVCVTGNNRSYRSGTS